MIIQNAELKDLHDILELQYLAYQSEAELFLNRADKEMYTEKQGK